MEVNRMRATLTFTCSPFVELQDYSSPTAGWIKESSVSAHCAPPRLPHRGEADAIPEASVIFLSKNANLLKIVSPPLNGFTICIEIAVNEVEEANFVCVQLKLAAECKPRLPEARRYEYLCDFFFFFRCLRKFHQLQCLERVTQNSKNNLQRRLTLPRSRSLIGASVAGLPPTLAPHQN
jgi:hypothetical protein